MFFGRLQRVEEATVLGGMRPGNVGADGPELFIVGLVEGVQGVARAQEAAVFVGRGGTADGDAGVVVGGGSSAVGGGHCALDFGFAALKHHRRGAVAACYCQIDGARFFRDAPEHECPVCDDGVRKGLFDVMADGDEPDAGAVGEPFDASRDGVGARRLRGAGAHQKEGARAGR